MTKLFILSLFLLLAPFALAFNGCIQYFPAWSNCDTTTEIQFFDFYLDHAPGLQNVQLPEFDSIAENFTVCAFKGNNVTIGQFNVQLIQNNSTIVLDQDVDALQNQTFSDGQYQHCFTISLPQTLSPGSYNLLIQVYQDAQSTEVIGCLNSHWEISKPIEQSISN